MTIARSVKRGGLPPVFSDMAHRDNDTGRKRPRYTKHLIEAPSPKPHAYSSCSLSARGNSTMMRVPEPDLL